MCSPPGCPFNRCITLLSRTTSLFNLLSWTDVRTETRSIYAICSPPGLIPAAQERPSDRYLSIYIALRPKSIRCVLAISPNDVHRCSRASALLANFCSSTTPSAIICLHSPQTKVCLLCDGVVFGNNHRHSRPLDIETPSCQALLSAYRLSSQPSDRSLSTVCQDFRFLQHDPWHYHPFSQPSDWSLSVACWDTFLVTTLGVAVHCLLRIFFVPNMTLGIVVCFHNPHTRVYLLCAGTYILPNMTLGVVVHLCSHQTRIYPLRVGACPAQPSV